MLFIRKRSTHRIEFIWTAKNWYFILDPIHFFTTSGSQFFLFRLIDMRYSWRNMTRISGNSFLWNQHWQHWGTRRNRVPAWPNFTSFQKRLRLTAGPVSQSLFVNSVGLTTSATLFAPCAHEEWLPACVLETQWSCGLLYFLQQMWLADQKQPNETGRSVPKGGKRSLRTRLQSAISQRKCCWMLEK